MAFLSALTSAAPGAAGLSTTRYGPTLDTALENYRNATGGQRELLGELAGGGPNLADQELRNATQRNIQANAAAIGSVSGINPALQQRRILQGTADLNQQAVGQAAALRMQQMLYEQGIRAQVLAELSKGGSQLYGTATGAQNTQNENAIRNQEIAQRAYEKNLEAAAGLLKGGGNLATGAGSMGKGGGLGSGSGSSGSGSSGSGDSSGDSSGDLSGYDGSGSGADSDGTGDFGDTSGGDTSGDTSGGDTGGGDTGGGGDAGGGGGFAHGGTIGTPLKREFIRAYCKAHGGTVNDAEHKAALLTAWHAGREHGETMENMTAGGTVGGPPPVVAGDSTKNDRTPAMLSRDERVIPKSIARDPEKVKQFIQGLNQQERAKGVMDRSPGPLLARRMGRR